MTKLQITTPEALPEESGADAALRPSRLDEPVAWKPRPAIHARHILGAAIAFDTDSRFS